MKQTVVKVIDMGGEKATGGFLSDFHAALRHFASEWGEQSSLADSVGVTPQYISLLMQGKRRGGEQIRRRIAEFYGYSYESFLEEGRSLRGAAGERLTDCQEGENDHGNAGLEIVLEHIRSINSRFDSLERRIEKLERDQKSGGAKRPPFDQKEAKG